MGMTGKTVAVTCVRSEAAELGRGSHTGHDSTPRTCEPDLSRTVDRSLGTGCPLSVWASD